jgi:hypothetical protein
LLSFPTRISGSTGAGFVRSGCPWIVKEIDKTKTTIDNDLNDFIFEFLGLRQLKISTIIRNAVDEM